MNKQIWKFTLELSEIQSVYMPEGADILSVHAQVGHVVIWALVNPENIIVERRVEVFGTGHTVPVDMGTDRKFIGTVLLDGGSLVFHVFERIS